MRHRTILALIFGAALLAACHPVAASGTCHGTWDAQGTLTQTSCSWDTPTTVAP